MKTKTTILLLVIILMALAACQPVAEAPQPTQAPPSTEVDTPATDSMDLAGTNWVLSSLNGTLPIAGSTATLQFGDNGAASGSDGCNRFSTTYTQNGSDLSFSQPMASGLMACPEPIMNQAAAFASALSDTTNFVGDERQLILRAGNSIVATFVAISGDLSGTSWDVVSYNNGREAVVGLITGTEISADFSENGELNGNAGCNQYFASFTASDGTIEIGAIGSSMRFCEDPPGVMEQEAEYLAALGSAATYSIQGNMLEMRTAGDQIAVMMVLKEIIDLPEPPTEPATAMGRVTGTQALNVRSGPGVNFPVIGVARNGDTGEIVGRSADSRWWATPVSSAPNGLGWVSADFVIATNTENVPVLDSPPPPTVIVPTLAPPATPTPVPAATATPTASISFTADRTNIAQGQCATLSWSVQNVQAVWIYPLGQPFEQFPRAGQGSETVCPTTTTTYEMRVQLRDGSTVFRQITINVAAPAATATPMPIAPTPTPAPPTNPLADTRWDVVSYNNGNDAVVSVINGTFINMNFGVTGTVSGNSGCNTFQAPYQADGNSITVGQPAGTSKACIEPEGVMEQESAFLNALQSAATFSIAGGSRLEMRTASGALAIVANRAP